MRPNHLTRFATLILTLLAVAVAAQAQSSAEKLPVEVPFNFSVANQQLPAGKYYIQAVRENPRMIIIENQNGKSRAIAITHPISSKRSTGYTRLVFAEYGDQRFLSQIVASGEKEGREISKSQSEKHLAMQWEVKQRLLTVDKQTAQTKR